MNRPNPQGEPVNRFRPHRHAEERRRSAICAAKAILGLDLYPAHKRQLLLVVLISLGAFGCVRAGFPTSWTRSSSQPCDLERIWNHTIAGLSNVTKSDFRACDKACRDDDGDACVGAGLLMYTGVVVEMDRANARRHFDRQCEKKSVSGCVSSWMARQEASDADGSQENLRGGIDLMFACFKGEKHACEAEGRYYSRKLLFEQLTSDAHQAAKYHTEACKLGSSFGCTALATLQINGRGVPKDVKKAVDTIQLQCAQGYGLACTDLGELYQYGIGVTKDEARAVDLFQKQCAGSMPHACYDLGGFYLSEKRPEKNKEGVMLLEKACVGGLADGCHALGTAYFNGLAVSSDSSKGRQYYEKACRLGGAFSCFMLGSRPIGGNGAIVENGQKSAEYLEQACLGGITDACSEVGHLYAAGSVIPRNDEKAIKYLTRACRRGFMNGCHQLARVYARATNIPRNMKYAKEYLDVACESGLDLACNEIVFHRRYGAFMPETEGEAVDLYLETCHAGNMHACLELGYLYQRRSHGAFDATAAVLFQKACDGGNHEGCFELGAAYIEGRGVAIDESKGLELVKNACRDGSGRACYVMGQRYRVGNRLPRDPLKAVVLLEEACPKVPEACVEAKALRAQLKEEYDKANRGADDAPSSVP